MFANKTTILKGNTQITNLKKLHYFPVLFLISRGHRGTESRDMLIKIKLMDYRATYNQSQGIWD